MTWAHVRGSVRGYHLRLKRRDPCTTFCRTEKRVREWNMQRKVKMEANSIYRKSQARLFYLIRLQGCCRRRQRRRPWFLIVTFSSSMTLAIDPFGVLSINSPSSHPYAVMSSRNSYDINSAASAPQPECLKSWSSAYFLPLLWNLTTIHDIRLPTSGMHQYWGERHKQG